LVSFNVIVMHAPSRHATQEAAHDRARRPNRQRTRKDHWPDAWDGEQRSRQQYAEQPSDSSSLRHILHASIAVLECLLLRDFETMASS
jgi:hypothetical protein